MDGERDVRQAAARTREVGAGLFILLAGWVAWRYLGVEGPHAVVLVAGVLGWLALVTLAAVGLGAPLWRLVTGEPLASLESWLVASASGAGALAALAGALAALGALRPLPLLSLFAVAAALGAILVLSARPRPRFGAPLLPAAVVAFGAAVTLLAVATPSPFYDQIHYHLAFPERWLAAGRLVVFPRHSYSYLAANMGLLYTYALAGPGVWGAQALHWWMGAVAAGAAFAIARRIGAGRAGASWAVAFLVATPSFLLSATWAASDLGAAAFGGVGALMLLEAVGDDRRRGLAWHLLAGAMCGAAFGCKYTAAVSVFVPAIAILCGALLLDRRRGVGLGTGALRVSVWGAGALTAVLPWAARNFRLTGDPLYPFLSASAAPAATGIAGDSGAGAAGATLWTLRTFDALGAAGWIGPLWLILLPLWLAVTIFGRRDARATWLGIAVVAGLGAWTRIHQLGRYLLPVLTLGSAGIGMAWERFQSAVSATLRRATGGLVAFLVLWSLQGGLSEAVFTRIACTFGRSDARQFLERNVTYWAALPIVNEALPADARLLLVGESRALHLERDVVVEDPFRTPLLVEIAEHAASPSAVADELRSWGITHLLFNDAEAARIARMRRRTSYFAEASATAAARLHRFQGSCLDLVGEAGPVRVFALAPTCRP